MPTTLVSGLPATYASQVPLDVAGIFHFSTNVWDFQHHSVLAQALSAASVTWLRPYGSTGRAAAHAGIPGQMPVSLDVQITRRSGKAREAQRSRASCACLLMQPKYRKVVASKIFSRGSAIKKSSR